MANGSTVLYAQAGGQLAAVSEWIDDHNRARGASDEAILLGRVIKLMEEMGEATTNLIALTGQNPRKPQDPDAGDATVKELLDVACTALAAVEHMTGNHGVSLHLFIDHVHSVHKRALG